MTYTIVINMKEDWRSNFNKLKNIKVNIKKKSKTDFRFGFEGVCTHRMQIYIEFVFTPMPSTNSSKLKNLK